MDIITKNRFINEKYFTPWFKKDVEHDDKWFLGPINENIINQLQRCGTIPKIVIEDIYRHLFIEGFWAGLNLKKKNEFEKEFQIFLKQSENTED